MFISGLGVIFANSENQTAFSSYEVSPNNCASTNRIETNETFARTVQFDNAELQSILSESKFFDETRSYTRAALLSLFAINQLVNAQSCLETLRKYKIALFNGTTAGGIDRSERYFFDIKSGKRPNLDDIIGHDPADSTIKVANFLKRAGVDVVYQSTISTACSSSAVAIEEGVRMLKYGEADGVICGGVDPLSKFTIGGFKSLGIYSQSVCRPFDAERDGLNLGEGAGYIFLTKEPLDVCYGQIISSESASDAFHQTATSDEAIGPTLALKKTLCSANVSPKDIKYINAHGTATPNNDETEATAMKNVFEAMPKFSSTKCYTGHTLGASGIIEAIICLKGKVFPTFSFNNKDEKINLTPEISESKIDENSYIMSNSFGFGGGGSSVILKLGSNGKPTFRQEKKKAYITFLSDNIENTSSIPANLRRRMSKMTKSGVAVALDNDIEFDALHVALGLGSISDTEKFLETICEGLPNPTAFIQSTFNTLAGYITVLKKNHSSAVTFVNRSLSFYNAIIEATHKISEGYKNVLIISAEEGTDMSNAALNSLGLKSIQNKAYAFVVSDKAINECSAVVDMDKDEEEKELIAGKHDDIAEYSCRKLAIEKECEGQMLHDCESIKIALSEMRKSATVVGSYAGQGKHFIRLYREEA